MVLTSLSSRRYASSTFLFFSFGPKPVDNANCRKISGHVNGFKCRCQLRISKPQAYAWRKIPHQIPVWMRTSNLGLDQEQYWNSKRSNGSQGTQPTPSTMWGWPPPGLAALFWFIPSPMEGVRATSSISLMINFRSATCISPNNLGSWNCQKQEQKCNMKNT